MQSKQILAQNQRIERITATTLVVGVDIAKERHVAQAMNFRGIVLTSRALAFANTRAEFEQFVARLRDIQMAHGMTDVVVGMESTGHYWFALAHWLQDQGITVVIVNPATTKRNKENRDNSPSKSDPKDAIVIAEVVTRGYYTLYERSEWQFHQLRVLVASRERWVQERSRARNRIIRWVDIWFPELTQVFPDLFTDRALATLTHFPTPAQVRVLTPDTMVDVWRRYMARAAGARGLRCAQALQEAAARSIGETVGLDDARWELQHLLVSYRHAYQVVEETDTRLEALLAKIPCAPLLRSVGIPTSETAAILAFGGDLRQLAHGDQLLRKAGLNLAERTSGKYKGHIKLAKRG
ncbi:IS110 family transposase, partial [Sulfobacillus harzensis]